MDKQATAIALLEDVTENFGTISKFYPSWEDLEKDDRTVIAFVPGASSVGQRIRLSDIKTVATDDLTDVL